MIHTICGPKSCRLDKKTEASSFPYFAAAQSCVAPSGRQDILVAIRRETAGGSMVQFLFERVELNKRKRTSVEFYNFSV